LAITSCKVDLHCHSYHSDGTLSPEALLEKAVEAQLDRFALTDHDTVDGIPALYAAARNKSIKIIPGIELSVRWKLHDVHILGLNIDIINPTFTKLLMQQNEQRILRAKQIAVLLEPVGLQRGYQKACDIAGHERIGRPHIAQVLVNENLASDLQTAFKRYLIRGKVAYIETKWLDIEAAVTGITQAGGRAIIAHPLKYKFTRTKLHQLILAFKQVGGTGIEVISGDSSLSQENDMITLCNRFNLLASSGSDYHQDRYSKIKLGHQRQLSLNCTPIWAHWP
jgi:3',5'-nucleoside bisphosphate phosphatase